MRVNKVVIIIGGRGVGKTTFSKKILSKLPERRKQLIMDTFDNPVWRDDFAAMKPEDIPRWQRGNYRVFSSDTDALIELIEAHVYNSVIFFEDSARYIEGNITRTMKRIIADSKQKNNDIFFVFHGLGQVPPNLYRMVDAITLFKVQEDITLYRRKIPAYVEVEKAFHKNQASKNQYINHTVFLT